MSIEERNQMATNDIQMCDTQRFLVAAPPPARNDVVDACKWPIADIGAHACFFVDLKLWVTCKVKTEKSSTMESTNANEIEQRNDKTIEEIEEEMRRTNGIMHISSEQSEEEEEMDEEEGKNRGPLTFSLLTFIHSFNNNNLFNVNHQWILL